MKTDAHITVEDRRREFIMGIAKLRQSLKLSRVEYVAYLNIAAASAGESWLADEIIQIERKALRRRKRATP